MKVLIPIGSIYPSQQGGPSNSMYWLASGLVSHGYDVCIISTDVNLSVDVKRNEWQFTSYGKIIFFKTLFHKFPVRAIIASIKELKNSDIVHLNSIFYPFSMIMGLACLIYKKKIIWSVRGELDEKALYYKYYIKNISKIL